MSHFCRTCLMIILPGEAFYNLDGQLSDESLQIILELESIVPQITLNVIVNPIICSHCVHALRTGYNFKSQCIQTEEKIYTHILETDGLSHPINISLVAFKNEEYQFPIDIKHEIISEVEILEQKVSPTFDPRFDLSEEFPVNGFNDDSQVEVKIEPFEIINTGNTSVNGLDCSTAATNPTDPLAEPGFDNILHVAANPLNIIEKTPIDAISNGFVTQSPGFICDGAPAHAVVVNGDTCKLKPVSNGVICTEKYNGLTQANNDTLALQEVSNMQTECNTSLCKIKTPSRFSKKQQSKNIIELNNESCELEIAEKTKKILNKYPNKTKPKNSSNKTPCDLKTVKKTMVHKSYNKTKLNSSVREQKLSSRKEKQNKTYINSSSYEFKKLDETGTHKDKSKHEFESACRNKKKSEVPDEIKKDQCKSQIESEVSNNSNEFNSRKNPDKLPLKDATENTNNVKTHQDKSEVNIVQRKNQEEFLNVSELNKSNQVMSGANINKDQHKFGEINIAKQISKSNIDYSNSSLELKIKRSRGRPRKNIELNNKQCIPQTADNVKTHQETFLCELNLNKSGEINIAKQLNKSNIDDSNSSLELQIKRPRGRPSKSTEFRSKQDKLETIDNLKTHQEKFVRELNLNKSGEINIAKQLNNCNIDDSNSSLELKIKIPRGRPSKSTEFRSTQDKLETFANLKSHQENFLHVNLNKSGELNIAKQLNTSNIGDSNSSLELQIKRSRGRPSKSTEFRSKQDKLETIDNLKTHQEKFVRELNLNKSGEINIAKQLNKSNIDDSNSSLELKIKRPRGRPSKSTEFRSKQDKLETIDSLKTHQEKFVRELNLNKSGEINIAKQLNKSNIDDSNSSLELKIRRPRGRPSKSTEFRSKQDKLVTTDNLKTPQEKFLRELNLSKSGEINIAKQLNNSNIDDSDSSLELKIKRPRGRPSKSTEFRSKQDKLETIDNLKTHQEKFLRELNLNKSGEINIAKQLNNSNIDDSNSSLELKIKRPRGRPSKSTEFRGIQDKLETIDNLKTHQEKFLRELKLNKSGEINIGKQLNNSNIDDSNSSLELKIKRPRGRPTKSAEFCRQQDKLGTIDNLKTHQEKLDQNNTLWKSNITSMNNTTIQQEKFLGELNLNKSGEINNQMKLSKSNFDDSNSSIDLNKKRSRGRPRKTTELHSKQDKLETMDNLKTHREKLDQNNTLCESNITCMNNKMNQEEFLRELDLNRSGELKTVSKENSSFELKTKKQRGRPRRNTVSNATTSQSVKPYYKSLNTNLTKKRKYSLRVDTNSCDVKKFAFECVECSYKTQIVNRFEHHFLMHCDDKFYKCTNCSYRTPLKAQLSKHRLLHTGEKPYQCKFCKFKSAWKQSLQLHVKSMHY